MRILSLLFVLFCYSSHGQGLSASGKHIDADEHSATNTTSWVSLVRPTVRNPLNAFYRFLYNNGEYKLELKISAGGVPFTVAQNAKLELVLENGEELFLYNEHYQHSCKGCGSRSAEANIPGVTLSFPARKKDIDAMCDNYLGHIRLYLADCVLGSSLTLRRTETFRQELEAFRCENGE